MSFETQGIDSLGEGGREGRQEKRKAKILEEGKEVCRRKAEKDEA